VKKAVLVPLGEFSLKRSTAAAFAEKKEIMGAYHLSE